MIKQNYSSYLTLVWREPILLNQTSKTYKSLSVIYEFMKHCMQTGFIS